jgi:hypothetical protein
MRPLCGRGLVSAIIKESSFMRRLLLPSVVLVCAAAGAAVAADAIKSGLEVGDSAPPFNVRDITGPNAGKTLCYR